MNIIPWPKNLAKDVAAIGKAPSASKLVKLIDHIEPWICADQFDYVTAEQEHNGKQNLLQLWDELNKIVGAKKKERSHSACMAQLALKRRSYACIMHISSRVEWDLLSLFPSDQNQETLATLLTLQANVKLIQSYRARLIESLCIIVEKMKDEEEKEEDSPTGLPSNFWGVAMHTIALGFFSLPMICGPLLNMVSTLPDPEEPPRLEEEEETTAPQETEPGVPPPNDEDRLSQPKVPSKAASTSNASEAGEKDPGQGETTAPVVVEERLSLDPLSPNRRATRHAFEEGDRVLVPTKHGPQKGLIMWIGRVVAVDDVQLGLELDNPVGEHDGAVEGVRYYHCKPVHGLLCGPLKAMIVMPGTEESEPPVAASTTSVWRLELLNKAALWFSQKSAEGRGKAAPKARQANESFLLQNPSFFEWSRPELLAGVPPEAQMVEVQLISPDKLGVLSRGLSKDTNFFSFFLLWLTHVNRSAHGIPVWNMVPGYWPLVQTFLRRALVWPSIRLYASKTLAPCLRLLLSNCECTRFVAFLTEALLRSTSIHNKEDLNSTYDLLDSWLGLVGASVTVDRVRRMAMKTGKPGGGLQQYLTLAADPSTTMAVPLPDTFCFELLCKAVGICLTTVHFQILLKTLTFLYMHVGRFYGKQREAVLDLLLRPQTFFSLFMHWHPEVRRVMMFLLLFRLHRNGDVTEDPLEGQPIFSAPMVPSPKDLEERRSSLRHTDTHINTTLTSTEDDGGESSPSSNDKDTPVEEDEGGAGEDDGVSGEGTAASSAEALGKKKQFGSISAAPSTLETVEKSQNSLPVPNRQQEPPSHPLLEADDPQFDACLLVRTQLTTSEIDIDRTYGEKLSQGLKMVHMQLADPKVLQFSADITMYAARSLDEYRRHCASFRRLQAAYNDYAQQHPTESPVRKGKSKRKIVLGQVFIPTIYFQITPFKL